MVFLIFYIVSVLVSMGIFITMICLLYKYEDKFPDINITCVTYGSLCIAVIITIVPLVNVIISLMKFGIFVSHLIPMGDWLNKSPFDE